MLSYLIKEVRFDDLTGYIAKVSAGSIIIPHGM